VAKRSLGVLTELWRRHIWRDVRTVNVIAQATLHPSPLIMLAALKFFLGQDAKDGEETEDKDLDMEMPTGASKDDVYKAHHKVRPSECCHSLQSVSHCNL
jgi:protein SDA1